MRTEAQTVERKARTEVQTVKTEEQKAGIEVQTVRTEEQKGMDRRNRGMRSRD